MLLLAACYDNSLAESALARWTSLRRKLGFFTWLNGWEFWLGIATTLAVFATVLYQRQWTWLTTFWPYLIVVAGWLPWIARFIKWQLVARRIARNVRVLKPATGLLRRILMRFPPRELDNQPLPDNQRTDDRYELLTKLQGVLKSLGSDRLVDGFLVWGDVASVKRRVREHLDAGADQLCIQPIHQDGDFAARDRIVTALADI